MTVRIRHQLTLFVPVPVAAVLESVRNVVDPIQASLIRAHVTFLREDEIPEYHWQSLIRDLQSPQFPLTLTFGEPERSVDHGILMRCHHGQSEFQRLRCRMFGHLIERELSAHLTLAHPRNPKAPGNSLENTRLLKDGLTIAFEELTLIRQAGNDPWQTLRTVRLCESSGS